jgi:RNA polymerase sigma-70 factor (ECF subfamily)
LYRIATNEVYTYFRSQKKNQEVELTEDNVGYIIEEANLDIKTIQLDAVIASLNNLKEEHTQLIEFRFFEKLSFKEIGQIYGITEANAKTKVYRVLDRIKKLITLTDKK